MADIVRIGTTIADIEKYIAELRSYNITAISSLQDNKTRHATSMLLLAMLNRLTDVSSELLSAEKVGAPTRYADIMPMLAKAGVINIKQAESLNKLIAKRNALAHFYGDVTSHDLLSMVKELSGIEAFVAAVKKRIAAQGKGTHAQDGS